MRITVLGAAGEVTGSGYLVQTGNVQVLVDFGLFQGRGGTDLKNTEMGPLDAAALNAVVLTHAHLDHVGRVPLLRELRCKIHGTRATCDLARIIMEDSAGIQEGDALRENRIRERTGEPPVEPLYTRADVDRVVPHLVGHGYSEWIDVAPNVRVFLHDAGHILGSSSVEMRVAENGSEKCVVFSGDVGQNGMPIINDPTPCPPADLVIMESTYGDRNHRGPAETLAELKEILKTAAWEKQKVLCPAFAVGRSQLLMHVLAEIVRDGATPNVPIYLDSPLAIKATEIYDRHVQEFDNEARKLAQSGQTRRDMRNVHPVISPAQSRELNTMWDPCVIIAGSGMCTGGRILHHLRHNLWKRGVQVLLTSFMGEGTLGRKLVDGATTVRIFREDVMVRAKVRTVGGLSAHAGQTGLLDWVRAAAEAKSRIVLTHGEERQRVALAAKIRERWGIQSVLPARFETLDV